MDADYVIFFVTALFVVIGTGLFRVGHRPGLPKCLLMPKSGIRPTRG